MGEGYMGYAQQTAEHPWVVLVEDDEHLEQQLSDALERALAGVEVQRTPDADVALRLVRDARCRALITEAHSAAVDGLTLAACARKTRPNLPLIFLGGAEAEGARARIASLSGSHMLEKPLHMGRLVGLVSRVIEAPVGFRGELFSRDLIELVQLVAMAAPTGALHLSAPEGRGTLWLDNGMIVHAVADGERGAPAFRRMMRWTSGEFSMDLEAIAPERSITFTTTQLLLDSTRLLDEESRSAPLPQRRPTDSGPVLILRSAAEHFERGLDAVQQKRYSAALLEWERALQLEPENRVYQHNLKRLTRLIEVDASRKLAAGGGQ
jgi:CheY-like chemotaxis protein